MSGTVGRGGPVTQTKCSVSQIAVGLPFPPPPGLGEEVPPAGSGGKGHNPTATVALVSLVGEAGALVAALAQVA